LRTRNQATIFAQVEPGVAGVGVGHPTAVDAIGVARIDDLSTRVRKRCVVCASIAGMTRIQTKISKMGIVTQLRIYR
jgi:hypothetical protein